MGRKLAVAREVEDRGSVDVPAERASSSHAEATGFRLPGYEILEELPTAIYTCDVEGRITYYNRAAADLWGRRPVIGKEFWCGAFRLSNADGTTVPSGQCPMALTVKGSKQVHYDGSLIVWRPDGEQRFVRVNPRLILDDAGKLCGAVNQVTDVTSHAVATFQNISEREHNERAIRHLAAIVEFSDDAIISKDLDGVVTSWNQGAEKLFGYTAAEMLGKPITTLIPSDRAGEEHGIMERIRRGERVVAYETIRNTKDGATIDISVAISPIKDQSGQIIGASKIARDIRRIKEYEAQLKREDRRKNEFIATLAHELRNPLAPLRHGLEIMRHARFGSEAVSDVRAMMGRQLEQMVRLIDDLLDVSRITHGEFQLRLEVIDVREIVHNAIESCQPLIAEAGHRLVTHLPDAPLEIMADGVRLTQILINLLRNAIKYTPSGGQIHLSIHYRKAALVIEVRDNGIGIPPQMLDDVFQPFQRIGNPDDSSGGGLGIGLTLVKQLVEMHGGTVAAHSEGRGKGSTFSVHLPPQAETPPIRSAASLDSPRSGKISRRILITDDNRDAALSLSHLLTVLGHETKVAFNGPDAIQLTMEFEPEVVILDIGMPKMNGYEACREIRKHFPEGNVTLVALTGWGQEDDRGLAEQAGFDYHLTKPLDLRALEDILRSNGS